MYSRQQLYNECTNLFILSGHLFLLSSQLLELCHQLLLDLPDTVAKRMYHSLSAIQLSPHNVLLVAFGGMRSLGGAKLSHTAFIKLSEYVLQYSSYSNRHCTVVCNTELLSLCSPERRWSVGGGKGRSSL